MLTLVFVSFIVICSLNIGLRDIYGIQFLPSEMLLLLFFYSIRWFLIDTLWVGHIVKVLSENLFSFFLFNSLLLSFGTIASHLLPSFKLFVLNYVTDHSKLFVNGHASNDILNIARLHLLHNFRWFTNVIFFNLFVLLIFSFWLLLDINRLQLNINDLGVLLILSISYLLLLCNLSVFVWDFL